MFFCKYDDICDKIVQKEKLFSKIENPKIFMVKLFPYFAGHDEGNISKYARGKDYHIVVRQKLENIISEYKKEFKDNNFVAFCDNSPLPEVYIAYKSGAGILGKQGLIFDREYGGYIFIGIIATDADIKYETIEPEKCVNCGLCADSCPTKSIDKNDFSGCLSEITQRNSKDVDKKLIKNSKLVWGCDICLDVCPMNKNAKITYIDEFRENLVYSLCKEDVEGKTRLQFLKKYEDRAFTFRGPKPICRNLTIKNY